MLKRILHIGIAVPDLPTAIKFYKSLGFEVTKKFHKPEPDMDVVTVKKGDTTFELFVFNDEAHPHVEFIRNHVAIYSDSIKEDVNSLVRQGYKLTIPIMEGVIFRYAFVQDSSGTNYEIATEKST